MAEQQFQERTEQATPKRKEEARRKGQVPRSRELNMALVMIGASIVMFISGPAIADAMLAMIESGRLAPQKLLGRTINLEQSIDAMITMDQFDSTGVTVITEF